MKAEQPAPTKTKRVNRSTYVVSLLLALGLFIPAYIGDDILYLLLDKDIARPEFGLPLTTITGLVTGVYILILAILRLHDTDKTGWLVVLGLLPLVNIIIAIQMLFIKGTDGQNKYGFQSKGTYIFGLKRPTSGTL